MPSSWGNLREQVGSLLHVVYPQAAMHDFRVVWGVTHSNVVFDVAVPFSLADSDDQVKERIAQAVSTLDPTYRAVVTVDRESTVNELESPATEVAVEMPARNLYVKCPACRRVIEQRAMADNLDVCPRCGHHLRVSGRARMRMTSRPCRPKRQAVQSSR